MNTNALLICALSGLSFLIGNLITKLFHDKKRLVVFSFGFAFSILIGLIVLDLLPECFEIFDNNYLMIVYIVIGMLILKALDLLLPHHEHTHNHKHIEHISLMSCIAIIIHNIIEATAIYTTSIGDIKSGILMAIGVSCHNIPLGIQITSMSSSNKKGLIFTIILSLSSVIGALLIYLFNIVLTEEIIGVLIAITIGMLLYIIIFELFCEIKEKYNTKEMFYGLFLGLALIVLTAII